MFDEFVYVLKAGPFYKIGKTTNVTRRIAELAIQLPFPVELFKVINSDDASGSEKQLHHDYARYRRNGEWFELPDESAMWLFMYEPTTLFNAKIYFVSGLHEQRYFAWEGMQVALFESAILCDIGGVYSNVRRAEVQADLELDKLCCFGV